MKTPSSIGASYQLIRDNKVDNVLCIVPASLKYQWAGEIKKFIDYDSLVVDGTKKKREKIYKQFSESEDIHYLLISYETFRNDWKIILDDIDFQCTIVDEAHRLGNRSNKIFKAVSNIETEYKFALTGTPLQNKPEEIYALMSWLQPDLLGGITKFKKRHIITGEKFGRRFVELGYKHLDELREKTAPFILRRLKEDVAPDLPKIIYNRIYVTMNKPQLDLYNEIEANRLLVMEELNTQNEEIESKATSAEHKAQLYKEAAKDKDFVSDSVLMGYNYMLEAVSDHPLLLLIGKSQMAKKYTPFIKKCKSSPKLDELISTCTELYQNGSKIIIFTKYAQMLKLIAERIEVVFKEQPYLIHGGVSSLDRQKAVESFSQELPLSRFMILTDAGNYGLNIQTADVLINYDNPWNPAVAEQRTGRIHRIGSKHEVVNVIDMAVKDSIEEKILFAQEQKTKMNKGIIEKTDEEVEILLKMIENANL